MTFFDKAEALFRPKSVAFIGGSNLRATLRYHRELGFAGESWVVNPKYPDLEGYSCFPSIEDLPGTPDLAFVAVRRGASLNIVTALREAGCRAVICNAGGFAELGEEGTLLQRTLVEAAGDMVLIGPNAIGIANFADPLAAMMDHFGCRPPGPGVAIISQGGGLLCDVVFADRSLRITHLVGCGNQAMTTVADCADWLLEDPRVTAIGLAFEGLPETAALRRAAAKAVRLGKPIIAMKFGRTEVGARAAASHTASMVGASDAWDALFDRLGIIGAGTLSIFLEMLKLADSGRMPKGRRVLVAAASGVTGIMLADRLSEAGFDLPQPSAETAARLRPLLPEIATPCNPQDITMAAWNDLPRQQAIYEALIADGYDIAMMVQNYPRTGMWDIAEYSAQVKALGNACLGQAVVGVQVAPLVDCFPEPAREETRRLGLVPLQGLDEAIAALDGLIRWQDSRSAMLEEGPEGLAIDWPDTPPPSQWQDEASAKAMLAGHGIPVPAAGLATADTAPRLAAEIGFPVALKALDPRILHKSEIGAVRLGLTSQEDVAAAVLVMRREMAEKAPEIPLTRLLVEAMAQDVVAEVMASVTVQPGVGPMMLIAGGGVEAELWNDRALIAFPVTERTIDAALGKLRSSRRIDGYRGAPPGDRPGLVDALMALARFAEAHRDRLEEIEINPILVCRQGVVAVDALLKLQSEETAVGKAV